MYQLSIISATAFVRTALDELTTVEETGMLVDADAVDLQRLVVNSIVEAVVKTHQGALSVLIDGNIGVLGEDYTAELDDNGVITITMLQDTLRVASVQAADSPVVLTDIVPEDSAEGRKQLNRYVRGVSDDPRVVLQKRWSGPYRPIMKYYSTEEDTCPAISLEYVPYPVLEEAVISISPQLEYAVLNELVAMVLDSVNQHDKAALYRAKSQAIMEGK